MTSEALYLLAWLRGIGETGWTEAESSDPKNGSLVMERGEERIRYTHKMSGGWMPREAPRRLRDRPDVGFRSPAR